MIGALGWLQRQWQRLFPRSCISYSEADLDRVLKRFENALVRSIKGGDDDHGKGDNHERRR